jgi:hypothetical protein
VVGYGTGVWEFRYQETKGPVGHYEPLLRNAFPPKSPSTESTIPKLNKHQHISKIAISTICPKSTTSSSPRPLTAQSLHLCPPSKPAIPVPDVSSCSYHQPRLPHSLPPAWVASELAQVVASQIPASHSPSLSFRGAGVVEDGDMPLSVAAREVLRWLHGRYSSHL